MSRRLVPFFGVPLALLLAFFARDSLGDLVALLRERVAGASTVQDRLDQYGAAARGRLLPAFAAAGVVYPPRSVALAGLKREKTLQLYAANDDGKPRFVRRYPFLAASGRAGPKLAEGDLQVPEGLYRIESLNPNSSYHLSLRVDYPNRFDLERAREEGRTKLGGDIMIHGSNVSIGCIAIGDPAIEEVFVLAADVGHENVQVILSPVDFRVNADAGDTAPVRPWVPGLYESIRAALTRLPTPGPLT